MNGIRLEVALKSLPIEFDLNEWIESTFELELNQKWMNSIHPKYSKQNYFDSFISQNWIIFYRTVRYEPYSKKKLPRIHIFLSKRND